MEEDSDREHWAGSWRAILSRGELVVYLLALPKNTKGDSVLFPASKLF